jgi:hypothetical protein
VTGSGIVQNTGQEVQITQSVPANNAPEYTTCSSAGPNVTCQVISSAPGTVTLGVTASTSAVHGTRVLSLNGGAGASHLAIADFGGAGGLSIDPSSIQAGTSTLPPGAQISGPMLDPYCDDDGDCAGPSLYIEPVTGAGGLGGYIASLTPATIYANLYASPNSAGDYNIFVDMCGDYWDPDAENWLCQFGPAAFTVTPAPTPSLRVTSNGSPVAQGTCDALSLSQVLYISPTPSMPPVTASIVMSDGSAPQGAATWTISGTFPQTINNNQTQNDQWGIIGPPPVVAANQPFSVLWSAVGGLVGGNAHIGWSYNGVQQPPYNFCILGQNPAQSAIQSAAAASPFWFTNNIAIHETNQSQFCDGTPQTAGAPYCASGGADVIGWPIFGPPGGYGVMQLDPPPDPFSVWNWSLNVSDGISLLQSLAGSTTSTAGSQAYPFWNRQIYQWNLENVALQQQGQPTFPPPEKADPGPYFSPNCTFIGSLSPATGISTPNTGAPNTYWYGDAVLMKQNNGTYDACGNNANYVSWIQTTSQVPGHWSFDKSVLNSSKDIVYEYCTCTTFQACIRTGLPTCN